MKKSQIYYLLQRTLITDEVQFDYDEKLEALRELFVQEDLAKLTEKQEEKQG